MLIPCRLVTFGTCSGSSVGPVADAEPSRRRVTPFIPRVASLPDPGCATRPHKRTRHATSCQRRDAQRPAAATPSRLSGSGGGPRRPLGQGPGGGRREVRARSAAEPAQARRRRPCAPRGAAVACCAAGDGRPAVQQLAAALVTRGAVLGG